MTKKTNFSGPFQTQQVFQLPPAGKAFPRPDFCDVIGRRARNQALGLGHLFSFLLDNPRIWTQENRRTAEINAGFSGVDPRSICG